MIVKKEKNPAFNFIVPVTDKELFLHCAEGRTAVSPGRFEKTVKPLLLAHGVREIRFT